MADTESTVLVTGATGFVGRAVTALLREEGFTVRALVRWDSARPLVRSDRLEIAAGNVHDPVALREAARGCSAVVHLVGILREHGDQTYQAVHVEGTANVVAACREAGIRRLIHMSALGTGRGIDTGYFRSKEAAEAAVRDSGLDWTVIRPSIIHGPSGDFMIQMAHLVHRLGPVPLVGHGDQVIQPVWVEDVARVFAEALRRDATAGGAFDVAGPEVMTLRDFYHTLSRVLLGHEKATLSVPAGLVGLGARVLGAVMDEPPVTPDELTMLQAARPCDIGPMVEAFGFEPARFEPTLFDYADSLRALAGIG